MEGGMARKVNAFLIAVCLLWAVEAGAISGNEWRGLPKLAQASYVAGVVDTWKSLVQASFDAKQQSPVITRLNESHRLCHWNGVRSDRRYRSEVHRNPPDCMAREYGYVGMVSI